MSAEAGSAMSAETFFVWVGLGATLALIGWLHAISSRVSMVFDFVLSLHRSVVLLTLLQKLQLATSPVERARIELKIEELESRWKP